MGSTCEPTVGYLHCLEDPVYGATAGYLVVSATGRPLEFHCTAPVKASHAQQILFGATLRRHLLGECLGGALLSRAKLTPSLLAISEADFALAATGSPSRLILLTDADETPTGWQRLPGLGCEAWLPQGEEASTVTAWMNLLAESIDPTEPFDRVADAIREAQRLGGGGADSRAAA